MLEEFYKAYSTDNVVIFRDITLVASVYIRERIEYEISVSQTEIKLQENRMK